MTAFHLLIRADAHAEIGTGHVMRCLALAQAALDAGCRVTFATACESEALRARVAGEANIELVSLPWEERANAALLRSITTTTAPDGLLLDGYHFDPEYQDAALATGVRSVVIDDYLDRERYTGFAIVNPNFGDRAAYVSRTNAPAFVGPAFAMLRREILRGEKRRTSSEVSCVLVTLGGSDLPNASLLLAEAALRACPRARVRLLAGATNPHRDALDALARANPRVDLASFVTDMSAEYRAADIVLCGAGSTCWEVCHYGVPALTVTLAENQRVIGEGLDERGIAESLGDVEHLDGSAVEAALTSLARDSVRRESMSAKGRELVDGRGAERVLAILRGDVSAALAATV